jgi:iron(III) transport system substrate-binding protein
MSQKSWTRICERAGIAVIGAMTSAMTSAMTGAMIGAAAMTIGATQLLAAEPARPAAYDNSVVDKAKAEGEVVYYTTTSDKINDAEIKAFNKEYPGIKVILTALTTGDLMNRFSSESQSGAPSADVVKFSGSAIFADHPDWFVGLNPKLVPNLVHFPAKQVKANYVNILVGPFGMTVNTTKVKEPVTQWSQFVEPSHAGDKAIWLDPKAAPGNLAVYSFLLDRYGEGYLRTLGKSIGMYAPSSATAMQQIAAGEAPYSVISQPAHSATLRAAGAPLKFIALEPAVALELSVGVASHAAHPNAAVVFANWLLSKEGLAAACSGQYANVTDTPVAGCDDASKDLTFYDTIGAAKRKAQILGLLGLSE